MSALRFRDETCAWMDITAVAPGLRASDRVQLYRGSRYGKAVLYFLARPPIRAFRLREAWVTGCSDTF
jgi:hypothetical protein